MPIEMMAPIALAAIALLFILVGLFQWLWNTTMPDVFDLKMISYWQAFRLLIMAAMLFGGLAAGG